MVQFYKDMPFVVKVSKSRYKDKQVIGFSSPQNIELDPYDGLKNSTEIYKYRPKVTVFKGYLPDNDFFNMQSGYIAPKGQHLFTEDFPHLNGAITIDDNGIVSGFYSDRYGVYRCGLFKRPLTVNNSFSFLTKIYPTYNGSGHQAVFACKQNNRWYGIRGDANNKSKFAFYNGAWTDGKTVISTNVWYWLSIELENGEFVYRTLRDDGYFKETLPDFSKWTEELRTTSNIFTGEDMALGGNPPAKGQVLTHGEIDLMQTVIKADGEIWWDRHVLPQIYLAYANGILDEGDDKLTATTYNILYDGTDITMSLKDTLPNNSWIGEVTIPEHQSLGNFLTKNYTEIGTVTYDRNGTSFGADSDVEADKTLPAQDYFQTPMSCTVRVKTPNSTSGIHTIMKSVESNGYFGINGDKWDLDGVLSTTKFDKDTAYWVTVQFDKDTNNYCMYVFNDWKLLYNDSNLPPLSAWTKVASTQFNPFGSKNHVIFGRDWNGYIELNNLSISTMSPTEDKTLYWRAIS